MDDSSTASSSVDIAADIVRLIPAYEHEAFRVLLKEELNGCELPADEMRKAAVSAWHKSQIWAAKNLTCCTHRHVPHHASLRRICAGSLAM
jgi:hypothetical protein